tara:strand:- start:596 stop:970 length:375 start_codon:yes stop_codon:yes gene_type:complete
MKIAASIFTYSLLLAFISFTSLFAQSNEKAFQGKWILLVKETPDGDFNLPIRFELVQNKLTGYFTEAESKKEQKMDEVSYKDGKVFAAFNMGNYELTLDLIKKDDDHLTGTLMGSFEVEGTRTK